MALPKEPRQKMINLMYLVLTALLALNVSAEILNAFRTVDNSLIATNTTINASTGTIMKSLQDKLSDPQSKEKAAYWYPKALDAQKISTEMYDYIQSVRQQILKEANFDPAKNGDSSFKQDNLDIATRIMVEEGKGKELYDKLADYKQRLINVLKGPDGKVPADFDPNSLQINLNMPQVQDKSNLKDWQTAYFHMVPTVAAITILSKFQNDVKTSENKVVAYCHAQVGQVTVRFDKFAPILGQSTRYLMPGQELEVTAGVGAFNSQAQPVITIGGSQQQVVDGVATFKTSVNTIGNGSIPVHISYKDQDGNLKQFDTKVEYTVGQANASIALDKMNVLYIGVDNPVSVAASGGGDDKTQVSIAGGGGSITKTGSGKYVVKVNSVTDDCKITVSVDGKIAGASVFRVRTIPDPEARIGNQISGANFNAGAFKAQAGVAALINGFPFDITYNVTSFTISCDNDESDIDIADVQGATWSDKARQIINKDVKPGRTVAIDNIFAIGPDGRRRHLPSIQYYIK